MAEITDKCVIVLKKDMPIYEGYAVAKKYGFLPAFTWIVKSEKEALKFKEQYDIKIFYA